MQIRGHMNEFHWLTTVMVNERRNDRLRHGNDNGEEDAHLPGAVQVAADDSGDLTERLMEQEHRA